MIDLSKLINQDCKMNNIYYSNTCNINMTDFQSKNQETLKLSTTFSLIKPDSEIMLEDFNTMYYNLERGLSDNLLLLKENIEKDNSEIISILKDTITDKYYEYIDLHIINLEDNNRDIIKENLIRFIEVFTGINLNSIVYDYIDQINNIFTKKILNIKRTTGLNANKYIFNDEKMKDIFKIYDNDSIEQIIDIYQKEIESYTSFSVYPGAVLPKIDLLDLLLYMYQYYQIFYQEEENKYLSERMKDTNYMNPPEKMSKIILYIYSASNIESSQINQKPNCYFILYWGEYKLISETIIKTSHPAWNKKIDIELTTDMLQNKLNDNIIIQFYNKDDNLFNQNMLYNTTNTLKESAHDEYIGEVHINLNDTLNLLNENNEYEGFYHVLSRNDKVKGQVNIKLYFEDKLMNTIKSSHSIRNNNNNNNTINTINTYAKNQTLIPTFLTSKMYQYDDDKDLDTKALWEKLNNNTVYIYILYYRRLLRI